MTYIELIWNMGMSFQEIILDIIIEERLNKE